MAKGGNEKGGDGSKREGGGNHRTKGGNQKEEGGNDAGEGGSQRGEGGNEFFVLKRGDLTEIEGFRPTTAKIIYFRLNQLKLKFMAKKKAATRKQVVDRSSSTGRFVSAKFAKANPKKTSKSTLKISVTK